MHLIYLQTNRDAHGSVPGVQQHPSGQNKRAIVVGGGGSATSVSSSTTTTTKQHGLSSLRKWTARPTRNGLTKGIASSEDSHRESHSGDAGQQQQQQGRSSRTNSINGSDMSMLQLLAFVITTLFFIFFLYINLCCVLCATFLTHYLSLLTQSNISIDFREKQKTRLPATHPLSSQSASSSFSLSLSLSA